MLQAFKYILAFFRTETPVMGAISKLILADSRKTAAYTQAVTQEKKGEEAVIHIGSKAYRLVRVADYHAKR